MKAAALAWLLVVLAAAAYLGLLAQQGLPFQTDLLALLPHEERDPEIQRAKDRVASAFGERIVILVGHDDRQSARAAGSRLARKLETSGMTRSVTHAIAEDGLRELGRSVFPFRAGLLAESDRLRLEAGRAPEIAQRALASVFGPASIADAALLRSDPFLLFPSWLTDLPLPLARIAPDDGILSLRDGETTWVFVAAQLAGRVMSLDFQERLVALVDAELRTLTRDMPGLRVLRTGALFYAADAAALSVKETSLIGTVSLLATAVLIVIVFRGVRTLLLNALALLVAIAVAFAGTFWIFGEIHVAALLFGVSLIGIAVDYSLHYSVERFASTPASPQHRLRQALPAITLGAATTVIGYLTLFFAPFPGLRQLAAFSAIGVTAAWLTVALWLPALDRSEQLTHGKRLLGAAQALWRFWEDADRRKLRRALLVLLLAAAAIGAVMLRTDDDVRRMQSLSAELRSQETEIQRLTGLSGGGQFLLIRGRTTEEVLTKQETILPLLAAARAQGSLAGFQAVAQYVPSAARQQENRRLVEERLHAPLLQSYWAQLGISGEPEATPRSGPLTPAAVADTRAFDFLSSLIVEDSDGRATHIVVLNRATGLAELRAAAERVPGVTLVDPTGDITRLLGEYRRRAVVLLAVSMVLMFPVLIWRFGLIGSLRVALPPAIALVLTPLLLALVGVPFTFFSAIALVLVLAMGIDYAVFCRESSGERRQTTMLGVWLASLTTLLSFGLLALSSAFAVAVFGATMLVGITLSFLLSPLAARQT